VYIHYPCLYHLQKKRAEGMALSPNMHGEYGETEPHRPSLQQALDNAKHNLSPAEEFSTNGTTSTVEPLPHHQSLEIFQDCPLEEQHTSPQTSVNIGYNATTERKQ
jgi:hypothetical protein